MLREETLSHVHHPERLRLLDGERVLICDPMVDRLTKGDSALGWEGDPRLALYVNPHQGRWEVWRLEGDGQRRLTLSEPGSVRGHDVVPKIIMRLILSDQRRGVVLADVVRDAADKADIAMDKLVTARNEDFADRLGHALKKDGVA